MFQDFQVTSKYSLTILQQRINQNERKYGIKPIPGVHARTPTFHWRRFAGFASQLSYAACYANEKP